MSAWWLAWQEGFAGFAWPWAWAALPLPLLAWLLLPPRQSSAAALRVPWRRRLDQVAAGGDAGVRGPLIWLGEADPLDRSEEHTSELQSLPRVHIVCRLLLEIGRASCRERV